MNFFSIFYRPDKYLFHKPPEYKPNTNPFNVLLRDEIETNKTDLKNYDFCAGFD